MNKIKNKSAVHLGRQSWTKRIEGKTDEQIKAMMSKVRKTAVVV